MSVIKLSNRQNLDLSLVYKGQIFKKKGDLFTTLGIKHSNTSLTNKVRQYITYEKTGKGCEIIITDIYDPDNSLETERAGADESGKCHEQLQDYKKLSATKAYNQKHSPYYKIQCRTYSSVKAVLKEIEWPIDVAHYEKLKRHLVYDQLEGYRIKVRRIFDIDGLTDGFRNEDLYYFFLKLLRVIYRNPSEGFTYKELVMLIFEPDVYCKVQWKKYEEEIRRVLIQQTKKWLFQLQKRDKILIDECISYLEDNKKEILISKEISSMLLKQKREIMRRCVTSKEKFSQKQWTLSLEQEHGFSTMYRYKELMHFTVLGEIPRITREQIPKHWEKNMIQTLFIKK